MDSAVERISAGGLAAALPAAVASGAGVARTAFLYHFPARRDFLEALAAHLAAEMTRLFDASGRPPPGVDASSHAIDTYWDLLQGPVFQAFLEVRRAARTDAELAAAVSGLLADFDAGRLGGRFGPLAQAGEDPRFQASRDLGRFLLEGLALGGLTYQEEDRRLRLIEVVKRAVHGLNRKGPPQDLWTG